MTLAALLAVASAIAMAQQQSPYVGRWNLTGTGADKNLIYFLEVKQIGDHLEGKFLNRSAHAQPVPTIKVENGELIWQFGPGDFLPKPSCGPVYHAKIEGGKLVGHHELPGDPCPSNRGGGAGRAGAGANAAAPAATAPPAPPKAPPTPRTINWVGVRQPAWPPSNANATHTYGKPIVIVGPGVGKETWSGNTPDTWQTPCEDRWTVDNGLLKNATKPTPAEKDIPTPAEKDTCNLYTKERFKDFKADAEFKLDMGQNSGFYIRGRYELQLQLSADPDKQRADSTYPGLLMDIYGWKRADVYAGLPADQWQVLNVVVVGNHITATLNGKRVHDNAVLPAFTGGALDNDELAPGPIMIQGDHSRVELRKLVVTPITKSGT
jgi:hypothetical protein